MLFVVCSPGVMFTSQECGGGTHRHTQTHNVNTTVRCCDCNEWQMQNDPFRGIFKATYQVTVGGREDRRTGRHSLALFMRPISFSSLMAMVMSPLMRSFPDMTAIVGFSFPKTQSARVVCIIYYRDQDVAVHGGAHRQTFCWSRWSPSSWSRPLWQTVRRDPRCQRRFSGQETRLPHVHLMDTKTVLGRTNRELHRSTNSWRSQKAIDLDSQWVSRILTLWGFISHIYNWFKSLIPWPLLYTKVTLWDLWRPLIWT